MTKDVRLWISKKRNNFIVQKVNDEGKREQVAKFSTKADAKLYVKKYTVAYQMEKVVDKQYNFKEQFAIFAEEKLEGGLNVNSCLTKSGGAVYTNHFNNIIKPFFPDVMLHQVTGDTMQKFIDGYLGKGNEYQPELYKTANRCLANIRRFLDWCVGKDYVKSFRSAMIYKIPSHQIPLDDDLANKVKATVIKPKTAAKLLEFVWQHRNDSVHAAYACMIFHILFYFGFRRSEILGMRKTDIHSDYIFIRGMFDTENWTWRNKTKNQGAKRKVYFDPDGAGKKLKWILDYSNKHFPSSDYVVAATRGKNPLSPFMFRKIVYATYEMLGLAKCEWIKDPKSRNAWKFRVISSPYKGCISKTWRHLKSALLIQSKNILKLSEDHIKRVMGHDLYSTTEEIYGDHDLFDTNDHKDIAARIEQYRNPIKLLN